MKLVKITLPSDAQRLSCSVLGPKYSTYSRITLDEMRQPWVAAVLSKSACITSAASYVRRYVFVMPGRVSACFLVIGTSLPTMFAQHFDDEPTLCFVRSVLDAHIAAINTRLASANIIRATFEDRLQCPIVKLTGEAIATAGWAVGVECIADEERSRVERERSIGRFGEIQCRECELPTC